MTEENQNDEAGDAAEEDPWADAMQEQQDGEAESASEDDPWAGAMEEQGEAEAAGLTPTQAATQEQPAEQPHPAELESFSNPGALANTHDVNLDVILDVPLTISMEIGRTKITIRNLLQLNQGSVVELDRMAGEHLDVRVNGTLVAHGEVVVVNDKFGIRLTDVISPVERIKNLRP